MSLNQDAVLNETGYQEYRITSGVRTWTLRTSHPLEATLKDQWNLIPLYLLYHKMNPCTWTPNKDFFFNVERYFYMVVKTLKLVCTLESQVLTILAWLLNIATGSHHFQPQDQHSVLLPEDCLLFLH